jgi:hypothetical protein
VILPRKAAEYSRVTDIIGFINAQWYRWWVKSIGIEEAERISSESASFGTGVHKIAENHLIGTEIPEGLTDRQKFCGGLIVQWCKETKVVPLILEGKPAVECELKSEIHKITGHPDLIGTFGSGTIPFIMDWKTSKKFKPDFYLQAAAYCMMIEEMYGIKVDDGAIIRTPNDPTVMPQFEVHEMHNLKEKYLPVFLHGLEVFNFFKNRGQWKKVK